MRAKTLFLCYNAIMPYEKIVTLRHRHRDLQKQDLETDQQISDALKNLPPEETVAFEAAKNDIDALRANLQTLLSNRLPSKLENEDVLEDANSLLTQIVFKQRALAHAITYRKQ